MVPVVASKPGGCQRLPDAGHEDQAQPYGGPGGWRRGGVVRLGGVRGLGV